MADFIQTMKNWKRLCYRFFDGKEWTCSKTCPLYGYNVCSKPTDIYPAPLEIQPNRVQEIEQEIERWTSEHKEQIYPTWAEWLAEIGVIGTDKSVNEYFVKSELFKPIPEDIAKKLGLKPKEI